MSQGLQGQVLVWLALPTLSFPILVGGEEGQCPNMKASQKLIKFNAELHVAMLS